MPKETGFISIVMEGKANEDLVLFAKLEDYQKKSNTEIAPLLTLQCYTELASTKDLVLLRGDVPPGSLTTTEAQYLVNQLQLYFLRDDKYSLVKEFNHNPSAFNYNTLVEELK